MEKLQQVESTIIATIVTSVSGGILWVVRRILTDQKRIDILERGIAMRDERREEDRADVQEIKSDIKAIQSYLLGRKN